MKNGVSTVTLDSLITAALTGQRYNHQRLGTAARRYARKLSNIYGKDLADDLHGEVFGEAFVQLFKAGAAALAGKSGKALFRAAVLSAIRNVRASYTPPGQRTRTGPKPKDGQAPVDEAPRVAAEDIGRVADTRTIERCMVSSDEDRALDFDLLEDVAAAATQRQLTDRLEAEAILRTAPHMVATALRLIHLDDEPVEAVADGFGISRFVLNRRIDAFCESWRAAA